MFSNFPKAVPRAWIQGQIFLTLKTPDGLPDTSAKGEPGISLPVVSVTLTSRRVMSRTLRRAMTLGRGQRVGSEAGKWTHHRKHCRKKNN